MSYFATNKVAAAILLQLSLCLVVEGAITTGDVCLSWHSSPCVGGDRGLTSTAVELSYRSSRNTGFSFTVGSLELLKNSSYNMTHSLNYSIIDMTSGQVLPAELVSFTFTQYEHGGGNCNCVDIYFDSNCTINQRFELCGELSSIPRILEVKFENGNYTSQDDRRRSQGTSNDCSSNFSIIQISFEFSLNYSESCSNTITNIENSSVELSLLFSSNKEWIPVTNLFLNSSDSVNIINVNQTICSSNVNDTIQLRWVQTNLAIEPSTYRRNVWSLNMVRVKFITSTYKNIILCDNFNNDLLDSEVWLENNIRNGNFSNDCNYKKGLVFGIDENEKSVNTVSRGLLTEHYKLFQSSDTPIKTDCFNSPQPSTPPPSSLTIEQEIVNKIESNQQLATIKNADFPESIELLFNLTRTSNTTSVLVLAYLLGVVVDQLSSASFQKEIFQQFLNVGDTILQRSREESLHSKLAVITIIESLDQFLFDYAPVQEISVTSNAVLVVNEPDLEQCCEKGTFLAIDTSNIPNLVVNHAALSIPLDLLHSLSNDNETIKVASSFYKNISHILNFGLLENTTVGSEIIGVSLQCGKKRCVTNKTISNVTIIFQHDPLSEFKITCSFIELQQGFGEILQNGSWSNRGCKVNENDSSESRTVCECNHLTHFAILLSPKPPELSQNEDTALRIIGYVGVSISLLAITLTIITFIAFKSLYSMRNYIHVNLCLNLAIAQIIFVAGVDKTSEIFVPIHCQVIAVLLHYFFLVSFMWMLMEGVVLYVALVRVFVKHKRRYILAFTVTSYGVPLVYMGALTLPLGFLTHQPHYGYDDACYLNYETNFIWAMNAPVILIFLANIGFLIMAVHIMWRHQMRQKEKSRASNFFRWIRAAFSLVVVMALTWISGILIFDDKLKVFAYIYPVLIGFQGFFIFLIFVVLSKTVREAYRKLWKVKVNESKLLSKVFKSPSLSSNMASNSNGKIQKKNEILKSQVSTIPNASNDESSRKSKEAANVSIVFTNDLVRSESPDTYVDDIEDDEDSGPEFEVKDQDYSIDEIVCSTALHINSLN